MLAGQNLTMSLGREALGIIEVQAILYLSIVKEKNFVWSSEAAPVYTRETLPVHITTSSSFFYVSFMDAS